MSLKHPHGYRAKEIVEIISRYTPKKDQFHCAQSNCFNKKSLCLAEYSLSERYLATLTGTAFDYLARFQIARKAEESRKKVCEHLIAGQLYEKHSWRWLDNQEARDAGVATYNDLVSFVMRYVNGGDEESEKVIDSCILLAKMEQEYRGGHVQAPKIIPKATDVEVKEDLARLLKVFNEAFLPLVKKTSTVVFNPTFGIASRMVGGADADIYIDGTLYDFKVHKENGWRSADAKQLMGYYLLDTVAKTIGDKENKLKKANIYKLGLYSARYGEVAVMDTTSLKKTELQQAVESICRAYLKCELSYVEEEIIKNMGIPLSREELWLCNEENRTYVQILEEDVQSKKSLREAKKLRKAQQKLDDFLSEADCIKLTNIIK